MNERDILVSESTRKGNISLENRKKLVLTGVIEVMSFDEEQISLNTNLGALNILGENLKVNKLDIQNGEVIILGMIKSMVYCGKKPKKRIQFLRRKEK